ncbi:transglutaminase TgpA family protein [Paenibacillus protaetiae]|uniref:Cysteine protease n=1 Tax=Paenibacillus protaetiae TaxID=2509456 RepID=A0A4V0YET2_9BACL|nr:transglutaminaseTgpA domain-containing protein [Paenibacillus protaetiae]QAY65301.1 cysteine protease [Paenibacillus protaetiae]
MSTVMASSAQQAAGTALAKGKRIVWYDKLSKLLVAIILWQSLSVFDGYWWKETMLIASLSILSSAVIEIAVPGGRRVWKLILQVLISLLIIVLIADAYHDITWLSADELGGRGEWLHIHLSQLSSFIWICASLIIIYTLFVYWVSYPSSKFGIIAASLTTLTVTDSFTPVWLWDNVAWVVLVGLIWLVASHLARFQRHHPSSWKELLEYPFQLFAPMSVILAVLMIGGLLMPTISPILQDPYTIWRESKGETVQTFIGNKAISSVQPVTTADTSSGYSRSDSKLGGGFNFDYSPVMEVTSSQRSYWRGETKDVYTGTGWDESDDKKGIAVTPHQPFSSNENRSLAATAPVEQTVRMIRADQYPVLFGAATIAKVNWVNNSESISKLPMDWYPDQSELRLDKNSEYPLTYSIESDVIVLDEDAIRQTHAGWGSQSDNARNAVYLQLPGKLPSRVAELAKQITDPAANDYDKARLLEHYLQTAYPYTNHPDLSKVASGSSHDFVDQFLFELKEGYCDYFSTAMAVMARSVGLPSRWVKGFAPGALPASPGYSGVPGEEPVPMLNPDGTGTYTVRNSDAHSWVEIYFDGFGWIPFEPTSGFSFPYSVAESKDTPDVPVQPDLSDDQTEQPGEKEQSVSFPFRLIGGIAGLLLLAAAGVVGWVRRQAIADAWERYRFRTFSANDRIVWETGRLLRKCERKGLIRAEHETLREAIGRWSGSRIRLNGELNEVLDRFELAKYSPFAATAEEAELFTVKIKTIIAEVK